MDASVVYGCLRANGKRLKRTWYLKRLVSDSVSDIVVWDDFLSKISFSYHYCFHKSVGRFPKYWYVIWID